MKLNFWWQYVLGVIACAGGFVGFLTVCALVMSAWDKSTWKGK